MELGISIGSNLMCTEIVGVDSKLMGHVEAHTDMDCTHWTLGGSQQSASGPISSSLLV